MNIAFLGFVFKVDAELKFHFPVFFFGGAHLKLWRAEKGAGKPPTIDQGIKWIYVMSYNTQNNAQLPTKQQTIGDLFFSFRFHELASRYGHLHQRCNDGCFGVSSLGATIESES